MKLSLIFTWTLLAIGIFLVLQGGKNIKGDWLGAFGKEVKGWKRAYFTKNALAGSYAPNNGVS